MLRAAAWTGGLFAVGGSVAHFFPGQFTEPLVLMALGAALFLVSGRVRPSARSGEASTPERRAEIAPASRGAR